ncbi:MAG: SpoIID/LytB domain-containing protein, partial [Ruthenibacterium sp.]
WGVINSAEFSDVCRKYNVVQGSYTPTQPRDKDRGQTYFVNNLYKSLLGHPGDEAGLNSWMLSIQKGTSGATAIKTFVSSQEFIVRGLNNTQIVTALFGAIFNHAPSSADIYNWSGVLGNYSVANTAEQMMKVSKEFSDYCKSKNINPGLGGNLKVRVNGQIIEGDAVDILSCIVNGEIGGFTGAGYNTVAATEAFKAQAVAAYTWIQYKYAHGDAAPTVAYLANPSPTIRQAVMSVAGQRVLYNGAPALTTYFASCAGRTNSAGEVWGSNQSDLPYLVKVDSPYDGIPENKGYEVERTINHNEMQAIGNKIFGGRYNVRYYSNKAEWLTVVRAEPNNYVHEVRYGLEWHKDDNPGAGWYGKPTTNGNLFSERANQALGDGFMRSPAFTVKYNGNNTWTFRFWGYGHGVGMSQWGAYGYAKQAGWNYQQILQHYYPGTTLA